MKYIDIYLSCLWHILSNDELVSRTKELVHDRYITDFSLHFGFLEVNFLLLQRVNLDCRSKQ
ncbi:hypothetical protein N475_08040 [Pseudoalteromonas luteoviolacea DSM 6061]|uniref:Uncharacterized protein n=1 Tax=Pseudoalteromonas luteoviolacea DSM 6061 TaxID=1365250 RepID=A0A161ZHS1_9GAMM|nr:hypothetical protein N475_08040 [Pseudoalteromonas luteoviolacea DSM 6061]